MAAPSNRVKHEKPSVLLQRDNGQKKVLPDTETHRRLGEALTGEDSPAQRPHNAH